MADWIGSLIGAGVSLVGAAVAWWRSSQAKWDQNIASLQNLQNKAIELAMQYPHLERTAFCRAWPDPQGSSEDDKERYDNYCCFIFNMLEQAWEVSGKKPHKVTACVAVREFVLQHHVWWDKEAPKNLHNYDTSFVNYIGSVITELKKAGTIQ